MCEREEMTRRQTRWYFYHGRENGYVYENTKIYKVFLLGSMLSQ